MRSIGVSTGNQGFTGWARECGYSWHYHINGISVCKRSMITPSMQILDPSEKVSLDELCGWCRRYLKDPALWEHLVGENHNECVPVNYDYDLLLRLTRDIPSDLDRKKKKEPITKELREQVIERDKSTCQLCGLQDRYGNPGYDLPGKLAIHHIIPNGKAELDNTITLCRYCHNAVHAILYASGKWRYVPMK